MSDLPIGIFDSGVGGLTVASALAQRLPHESLLYVGDSARCPYGPRDPQEVAHFVQEIASWMTLKQAKLIVIACNTATAAGLKQAQRLFNIPVIGVVAPGARAAVYATRSRRVGVIGTVGTVNSGAYTNALRSLDAGITVFSTATPRFVEMVEEGLRLERSNLETWLAQTNHIYIRPAFEEIARDYLIPLKRCDIDTLVLGCTHFPLLTPLISQVMGSGVKIISSAQETAKEVEDILSRQGTLCTDCTAAHRFYTTQKDVDEFVEVGSRVLGFDMHQAHHLPLADLQNAYDKVCVNSPHR